MFVMISEPTNILRELYYNEFKKIIHLLDALLRAGNKATASRTTQLLRDLHIQGFTKKSDIATRSLFVNKKKKYLTVLIDAALWLL